MYKWQASIFKRYHCVKQHDIKDCAAACLATISRHFGLRVPISKIREAACTDMRGASPLGVIKAAKSLGFSARAVKGDREDFFGEFNLPSIAHVIAEETLYHYVVIYEISEKEVIVADPAKGIVRYTPDKFFKIWTGTMIILEPTEEFKKGNEERGIIKRFFILLIPQKKLIIKIFLASLLYTLLGIAGSFYYKYLMDEIIPKSLFEALKTISIAIILLETFKVLLGAYRQQLLLYLSQKLDIELMLGYYKHVVKLPVKFFAFRKVGEIVSRFTDAGKVREAISGATLTIMIDTIMAVAGGIILYNQNQYLFGITVIMVIIYAILVYSFNKPIRDINREEMESNAILTSYLVESLNGIETLKAFNAEEKAAEKTDKKFMRFLKAAFKAGSIGNLENSLTGLIAAVGGISILWAGALGVINGSMTIGQLITFNVLLAYFLDPVRNLIALQPMMQTAVVASDRLGEILDLEPEKKHDEGTFKPETLKGDIEIKNLEFSYGFRKPVLVNISVKIKQGEKIAFVGESGSGKTTLVKLLMKFYNIEKGEIFLNGINLKDIDISALREKIAYISQDTFFFSGSIRENLSLAMDDLDISDIKEASKMAEADEFISSLYQGYDTLLEENASNLSGGQRQRLAITRALLKKPDIFIMDEATSNLDSITEKAVEKTINEQSMGITTIIIAHRLSTIKKCDRIFVMDKGQIAESGTHRELMELGGIYYNLWREQFSE